MLIPTNTGIFSVSRLNQTVRQLLELEMGRIWLSAEMSNFSQPSSGHWYFTLKDERAQIRAAMFRSHNLRATFRPQNGQQVLVRAQITLYEPRGDYQLVVESIQPAGDGLLQQQFEVLKQKLTAEGLFDQIHKKSLPSPAKRLGVITSASGAALHDILNILKRRDPSLPIVVYPTAVQGTEAPLQIIRAIELANARQECDVLIVGRGGGSLEDLWCFNNEHVARAIFQSQIPIVSAVGHETDVTIADFIADLRAPTPSAAAELVSRNQIELLRQIQSLQQRQEMAMDYFLAQKQRVFSVLLHRLQQQRPDLRLARQQNHLTELRQKLTDSFLHCLKQNSVAYEKLSQRLLQIHPERKIQRYSQSIQQFDFRLKQAVERQLGRYREKFAVSCSRMEAVSPLATLSRGYSISEVSDGKLLKQVKQIKTGDMLKTRLQDGWVESQVTQVIKVSKRKKLK
ncbi:exodeoxyribonuclease VII large subunit [Xenorhabdus vietnamensis]|uniref:Exodeoxyribonuclease 7 large subunit n=1 Tax=Xenorhabdus vietnamensis TaxID=351656 RepID=A0A1Y2SDM3_9GAMM|nr:exodeoxyribonuclease VII large subunit [Xenorhabdus vietnamensis]OTA16067.1 exodeoxyribonuclease VII large subunit [Xenorhabdus vietnamensis]